MNLDTIGIFDRQARIRAILLWDAGTLTLENIPGFDVKDIQEFLASLSDRNPRRQFEEDGKIYLVPTPEADPLYHSAVLQELQTRGVLAYPIERYQKKFLLALNQSKFDTVRKKILGDMLTVSKEELPRLMEDLEKGMDIVSELNELHQGGE